MTTFRELEEATNISQKVLQETLEDYAKTGCGISSMVVIGIIEKAKPNEEAINKLIELAQKGADRQTAKGRPKDANEYKNVIVHLQNRLPY